jgi:hypothetical protein
LTPFLANKTGWILMDAKDFLKVFWMLWGLIFALFLGFLLVSYFLGYFSLPFSEWTMERVWQVLGWVFLIIFAILLGLSILRRAVAGAVSKRGPGLAKVPPY